MVTLNGIQPPPRTRMSHTESIQETQQYNTRQSPETPMEHHPSERGSGGNHKFQARLASLFSSRATVLKKPQSSLNQSMDDAMLLTYYHPSPFSKRVGFEEDRVRVQHPLTSERFKSVPKKWSKSPSFQKQADQPHDGS